MSINTPSQRPDETRANYTRAYLVSKKIDFTELSSIATDMEYPLSEEDFNEDAKLVSWVKNVQKKIGFAEDDNATGQDGMFGPRTLREIRKWVVKNKTGKATDVVAATIKPPVAPEVPKPQIEHKGYHGQPETPISKLNEVLSKYKGKTWAGPLSGNGGRPVAIYVPEGFDPNKPTEIAYHFHGTHSHLIDMPMPQLEGTSRNYQNHVGKPSIARNRIDQALSSFARDDSSGKRNAIIVYPLSAGQRTKNRGDVAWREGYDNEWMKKGNDTGDDMEKLHQETLSQLGNMGVKLEKPLITLSGHSAGGVPLQNILTSGFMPDKVKFLDASYSGWATNAYQAAKKRGAKTKFEIYVHKGSDKTDNAATKSLEHEKNVSYTRSPVVHDNFNREFI